MKKRRKRRCLEQVQGQTEKDQQKKVLQCFKEGVVEDHSDLTKRNKKR